MGLAEKVSSDILITTVIKLSLKVRGLVLIPVLTIGISVGGYGAYTQAMGIATLLGNLCVLGTDQGFVRYIHKTNRPAALFTSLLLITATASAIGATTMMFAADTLATYTLSETGFAFIFVVAALYIPATIFFQLGRAYFRAQREIKRFSVYEAIEVLLFVTCVTVSVFQFNATIAQAFGIVVAARFVTAGVIFAAIAADGGLGWPSTTALYGCLAFSIGTMGYVISQSLLDKTDRVLLGFFLGANAVGVYSAAYSVSYLMLLYFKPLSISFFPEFSKLWDEHHFETIQVYTRTGLRYVATLGFPSVAGFVLIGPSILELLSTSEVAQAGAIPLVLLSSAIFCKGAGELYIQLFFAVDEARWPATIQGGTAVLNIILNIMLIPLLGIYGAVIATLLSFGLAMLGSATLFQRWLHTPPPWDQLGRIIIATVIMYSVFSIASLPWLATLLLAPIVYIAVLISINGLKLDEIKVLLQKVR